MDSFFQAAFSQPYLLFSILFAVGLIELAIVFAMYQYRQRILENGQETTGRVVDIEAVQGSKGGTVYYPVFEFRTNMNEAIRKRSRFGGNASAYKVGDEVAIVYHTEKPERFLIRDDKSFRLVLYIMGGLALLFFTIGLYGLRPLF